MTAFLSSTLTLSHLSHLPHNTHHVLDSLPLAMRNDDGDLSLSLLRAQCKYGITCKFEHNISPTQARPGQAAQRSAAMMVDLQYHQQQMQSQQQQGHFVQQQSVNHHQQQQGQGQGQGQVPCDELKLSQLSRLHRSGRLRRLARVNTVPLRL